LAIQYYDVGNGFTLPLSAALNGSYGTHNLRGYFREGSGDRFSTPAGAVGFGPGGGQTRDYSFNRGRLLLRCARGLFGASGNLLHRPSELFGRCSGLGKTTRQLFRCGRKALGHRCLTPLSG
jgi:hypothetical protein